MSTTDTEREPITGAEPGSNGNGESSAADTEASRQPQDGERTFTKAELDLAIAKAVKDRLEREAESEKKRRAEAERKAKEEAAKEAGQYKELYELAKAELEQVKADIRKAETDRIKARVAARYFNGRKPDEVDELTGLLKGETEDELEAHAKKLVKMFAPPKAPDLQGGAQGGKVTKTQLEEQVRASLAASSRYIPN